MTSYRLREEVRSYFIVSWGKWKRILLSLHHKGQQRAGPILSYIKSKLVDKRQWLSFILIGVSVASYLNGG